MGYYQGSGIVSGGGESTRPLKSFYEWGTFAIRQKSVTQTVKYPGVSKATAEGTHCGENLTAVNGGSGDLAWIIFDAEGTRTDVSYSQISDSNLYELYVTTETLSVALSQNRTRNLTGTGWGS